MRIGSTNLSVPVIGTQEHRFGPRWYESGVRIGVSTPVVMQLPGTASGWEADGDVEALSLIAETADQLGFDYLTCSEHVAVPRADATARGATYWDPLATLAFLAARTTRVRLVTAVVVLGYHHPLAIAKRYGTLDRLSAGRLVLGVGVGSLAAEFELLGAPFDDRGPRADDALRALRSSLSNPNPAHDGPYYRYDSMVVDPCAVQSHVPIWVGGRSGRSLRRAVTLADGWMPFGLTNAETADLLATVDLPPDFEIALPCGPLDPGGAPDTVRRRLSRLSDLGATAATCTIAADSPSHYCRQLEALRGLANDLEGRTP